MGFLSGEGRGHPSWRRGGPDRMVRIAISAEAYDALASTIRLGSVVFEKELDANGQCHVRLNRAVVDRLRAMRGVGESYSDVIQDCGPLNRASIHGRLTPSFSR